jgi:hypothetical protein
MMWTRFKTWLVVQLGGTVPHDCEAALWSTFPKEMQDAVAYSCEKVRRDPSFAAVGSNLGRNIKRDEACEWAKLRLKDAGIAYSDSAVHLACELYYRVRIERSA